MQTDAYDVLIIGSGAAGLRAAIEADHQGARVAVLSKGSPGKKTATIFSGGVFAGSEDDLNTGAHRRQTLDAGRGINQTELVDILTAEGPLRLEELMRWGIDAEFNRGYLFAKGRPPLWGEAIVNCLVSRCRERPIDFHTHQVVTRVLPQQPGFEVTACSPASDERSVFSTKTVILATGGAAALYARHDNPGRMLGDGWVLALEAGAVLQDLEFVQFYPLGLFEPGLPGFLISPALADQGRLYNQSDQDILTKYKISERPAGMKARDKLSQALFNEVWRENGAVWLDVSTLSESAWRKDPFAASTIGLFGERYGARHRPVRVAPMAHHTMGGVVIDPHGATSVAGLFAAGEVTGGLHGANRMGGNALTETVVFGRRAGEAAAACAQGVCDSRMQSIATGRGATAGDNRKAPESAPFDPRQQLAALRRSMWSNGGIVRDAAGLGKLIPAVAAIGEQARAWPGREPKAAVAVFELAVAARAAELIIRAALRRAESRGVHFRSDFAGQNDEQWQVHLQVRQLPDGDLDWQTVRS